MSGSGLFVFVSFLSWIQRDKDKQTAARHALLTVVYVFPSYTKDV